MEFDFFSFVCMIILLYYNEISILTVPEILLQPWKHRNYYSVLNYKWNL